MAAFGEGAALTAPLKYVILEKNSVGIPCSAKCLWRTHIRSIACTSCINTVQENVLHYSIRAELTKVTPILHASIGPSIFPFADGHNALTLFTSLFL